jgi:hypothetical protein
MSGTLPAGESTNDVTSTFSGLPFAACVDAVASVVAAVASAEAAAPAVLVSVESDDPHADKAITQHAAAAMDDHIPFMSSPPRVALRSPTGLPDRDYASGEDRGDTEQFRLMGSAMRMPSEAAIRPPGSRRRGRDITRPAVGIGERGAR